MKIIWTPKRKPRKSKVSLIVLHYTVLTYEDTIRGFTSYTHPLKRWSNKYNSKYWASAHFVVDRDGSVVQMAKLSEQTNHAGVSEWKGRKWANTFSIGIEIVNYGLLKQSKGKISHSLRVGPYSHIEIPEKDVVEVDDIYWHRFTERQIESVKNLCGTILSISDSLPFFERQLEPEDIVGHCDVSPGRKIDPGEAFPWDEVRDLDNFEFLSLVY